MAVDNEVDVAIVGAGVVGCAIASALAADRSVVVLEAGPRIAEGTTSRNSGVVHSGLYYRPGSLKARLCVEGNRLLYDWAARHDVPHAKIGKLVIARDAAEIEALQALERNARASDAPGVGMIGRDAIRKLEPTVDAECALLCRETGIVDPVELTRSYAHDASEKGALITTSARVRGVERTSSGWRLDTERGEIACTQVVNAAGLHADEVAALAGIEAERIHPCRGDYFRLRTPVRYRHLIYPMRPKGSPGLGVHLTLDLAGGVRLGPDAEFCDSRTDYSPREDKLETFLHAARRLLGPSIEAEQLSYDGCGIRPKLAGDSDFVVRQDRPGFVNLIGIESPGLTAALALARVVREMLG